MFRTRAWNLPILFSAVLAVILLIECRSTFSEGGDEKLVSIPDRIDYNFHVKPILSDRCYSCHGPDPGSRKANLRLDKEEEAFAALENGKRAFVRGSLHKSEAFQRITSDDPSYVMPPPESKLSLSDREIAIISKWLNQGAKWKPHWSFIPVERPAIPRVHSDWTASNEIDFFIQDKLKDMGLDPSPEVDKERLLRRVSLDLTGLPPSVAQIDSFLSDSSEDAYEQAVDRLLQLSGFGERLAMEWLDVARYADSHGVSFDGYRNMWPYRDWVIRAFNEGMPIDEFITKQVAGDLLEDPEYDDLLATAFYRLNPMEASMGSIEEEYRQEYVAERTATTGTAFLGLTVGCARCHDHKFDPISHREFYSLSAFFNSVDEMGLGPTDFNRAPTIHVYKPDSRKMLDSLSVEIQEEELRLAQSMESLEDIAVFIQDLPSNDDLAGQIGYFPFDTLKKIKRKNKKPKKDDKKEEEKKKEEKEEEKEEKEKKEEDKFTELLILDNNKQSEGTLGLSLGEGRFGKALHFDEDYDYASLHLGRFEHYEPFSASVWIRPASEAKGNIKTILGNSNAYIAFYRGWEFALDSLNRLQVKMIHRLPDNYIEVNTVSSVTTEEWSQVGLSYDGSGSAKGVSVFINGMKQETTIVSDCLSQSIHPIDMDGGAKDTVALRVGKSHRIWTGDVGLFTGHIDEVRIFDRQLSSMEMTRLAGGQDESPDQALMREHTSLHHPEFDSFRTKILELKKAKGGLLDSLEEVMVMRDVVQPRKTYLLDMGLYNAPLEVVEPGTPAEILAFPENFPKNRLGLARWLVHPENPLVSRVLVNRYWQMIFGTGIVKSTEDFGIQGDLPTHPELLDWLANEFMESGWDLKKLLKKMVMSKTYRQSSMASELADEIDPENRLYSHSNSYRLQAEIIRDNALAASGLLSSKMGGPSVKPYQPDGLWQELIFSERLKKYEPDSLDNLYRRSIYTFVRRFMPHPFLTNFDATSREVCATRRIITNTPLQALNLLNDPQFVEAARILSERIQREGGKTLEDRITFGYRLSTGVRPSQRKLDILKDQYKDAFECFEEYPALADSLFTIGETHFDTGLEKTTTAALTVVASTIFNHDETYMKR